MGRFMGALGVGGVRGTSSGGVHGKGGASSLRALGGDDEATATPFQKSYDLTDGDFDDGFDIDKTRPLLPNEARCQAPPGSGTVVGAVALVTGSTVGAGILALPQTIAPAGIGPSSAAGGGTFHRVILQSKHQLMTASMSM
jgi:hypothetical protein